MESQYSTLFCISTDSRVLRGRWANWSLPEKNGVELSLASFKQANSIKLGELYFIISSRSQVVSLFSRVSSSDLFNSYIWFFFNWKYKSWNSLLLLCCLIIFLLHYNDGIANNKEQRTTGFVSFTLHSIQFSWWHSPSYVFLKDQSSLLAHFCSGF